jgi:hydrogenase nickel incorporation protein HypB
MGTFSSKVKKKGVVRRPDHLAFSVEKMYLNTVMISEGKRRISMQTIHPDEGEILDIELEESLLAKNRDLATRNQKLLEKYRIQAIDILGSIGSGKTSLIQQMVSHLKDRYQIAALAGDLTTTIDAERIENAGAPVIQINTGKECHLDGHLVSKALNQLNLADFDLIFIENVGNLICPGEFPVGAHQRMVVVSVTEGPYMILKHPYILAEASALAINKIDLAETMRVSLDQLKADALGIRPGLPVIMTNGRTGEGIPDLLHALNLT